MANWWDSYPDAAPQTAAAAAQPQTRPDAAPKPGPSQGSTQGNWWDQYPDAPTAKTAPEVSGPAALQNGFEDMFYFGGKDEAFAGLDAAAQPLFGTGNEGESFSDRYNKNLADQRAFNKASQDQHPVLNTIGGVAGAVAPLLLTGGLSAAGTTAAAAGAKATLSSTAAKSAAIGAAQGGAYGFGSSDGDLGDRASEAAKGAAIGGALGAAIPVAVAGGGAALRKLTPDSLLPTNAAQKVIEVPEGAAPPGTQSADFVVGGQGAAQRAAPEAAEAGAPGAEASDAVAELPLRDTAKSVVDAANAPARSGDQALGDLAAAIQPQKAVVDAAERLGVTGLTPGQLSGNQTFRNIEGALSALPGNELSAQKAGSLAELSQKADDFINEFGGNTDKAAFSDDFKRSVTSTISGLNTQADDLYKYIGKQIPNTTEAPANNTIAYIQGRIADLGGAPLLNADQRKALAILSPRTFTEPAGALFPGQVVNRTQYPTYAALDLVRKQVGQGYSRSGPFKDMQSGQLEALYSTLTRDQEALVNSVSPELGAIYKGAKSVVSQRKELEGGLQAVLGKDLSGSIATSLGSSVKQLSQGNFKNFDNIMQHIPEASRQDAVVTALNEAFTNKSGSQKQLSASGFASWYGDLNRNNAARTRLTKYLPEDAKNRLDDIYTVAKAMSDASGATRHTGVALAALDGYAAEGGILSKIWGIAKPALVAEGLGTAAGIPGLGAATAVISAIRKDKLPIQDKAAKLLSSDQLKNMLTAYVRSGGELKANVLAREKQLVRTQAYRSWEKALDTSAKARIATVGPLVYLTESSSPAGQTATTQNR